jgi:hypothetical protein
LFGPGEEHDAAFEDVVEGALIFLLEDDFSEIYLDEVDVADDDLEVLVALLLVDEVEEGDFQQEMLLLGA